MMAAQMPPLAAFRFVEYAINGANRRNRVGLLEELDIPISAVDAFTTWFRYTDDLPAYLATNRNGKGGPSVSGYAGLAYAPRLVADFDSAGDLGAAHRDAITFATRLG